MIVGYQRRCEAKKHNSRRGVDCTLRFILGVFTQKDDPATHTQFRGALWWVQCAVWAVRAGHKRGGFEAWRRAQNNIGKFPDICARFNYYLTVIITFDVIK